MKKEIVDKATVYESIFSLVRLIPEGRITSYGAIAKALQLPTPRIVGHAMGATRGVSPPVPVQRVVNSQGMLSGDNGYRQQKLEAERITVENGKVKEFKKLFWNPLLDIDM